MLTVYLIGLVIVLIGGLICLREGLEEVTAGDVAAILIISLMWFIMLPILVFIKVLDLSAKLLTKDKK